MNDSGDRSVKRILFGGTAFLTVVFMLIALFFIVPTSGGGGGGGGGNGGAGAAEGVGRGDASVGAPASENEVS